jgi:hypothetical protein
VNPHPVDASQQIRGARIARALCVVPAVILTVLFAVHLASGALVLATMNGFTAALFVVPVVLATARIRIMRRTLTQPTPSVRESVLRHIAHRPRRTMTTEDYRQLRKMELELGFEPSETPTPAERATATAEAADRAAKEALTLRQSLAEASALPPLDRTWTRADWDAYESVCRRSDPDADYLTAAFSSGCLVNLQGSVPAPPRCECATGTFSSVPVFTIDSAVPVYSYCSGCHRERRQK